MNGRRVVCTGTSSTTSYLADQALATGPTGNRVGTSSAPSNSTIGQLVALKPAASTLQIRAKTTFLPLIKK